MNTNKHTPGPWAISKYNDDLVQVTDENKTRTLAVMDTMDEQGSANAALVAAAPEMLEALELVYKKILSGEQIPSSWITSARDAIAKAGGNVK